MQIVRWGAWAGIAAAPLASWLCGGAAWATLVQLEERWTIDGAVVLAIAVLGSAIAGYLSLAAAAMIAAHAARGLRLKSLAARLAPPSWRSLVSAALGVGIATGIAAPGLASEEPDVHLGWVPPAADVVVAPVTTSPSPVAAAPVLTGPAPATSTGETSDGGIEVSLHGFGPQEAPAAPVSQPAPAPAPAGATGDVAVPTATSSDAYVVERGDSLWRITEELLGPDATDAQIAKAWPELYEENRAVIGANPSLIYAGQVLHIPGGLK